MADTKEDIVSEEIAAIYDEVRELWGSPYVSAVHRVMAQRPNLLEWSWEAIAPAFRDGRAQVAAWAAAEKPELPKLDAIPEAALRTWGVDNDALATVRAINASFVRVAPVNMMFAALVKRVLIEGRAVALPVTKQNWQCPKALAPLPEMVEFSPAQPLVYNCLLNFASQMHGEPFVPGLYRMLGHWPGLLAHLATVLPVKLDSKLAGDGYNLLRARIDRAAGEFDLTLPLDQLAHTKPADHDVTEFLETAKTYRKTSPELVVAGQVLMEALPSDIV